MTMRHPERLAVLAGVALALASVLFGGCPSSMSSKGDVDTPDTKSSAEQAARRIPVVLTPVEQRVFEERLAVQGTLEAKRQLYVPARIDGPLDNIFVDEGDVVVAGETKLFKVEDIKLEEAARIRRQDLNVARCALREKEANLENAKIQLSKAERDYERFKRLHAKKAVTDDTFEQQETRYKLAKVGLEHAHTLIKLGEEQVKQAEAALAIAEKNLEDTLIYAPIDGRVSAKFKEMGEFIGTGNAVVRIEDPSVLEVSAYLPASVYAQLHPGETELRIQVSGIEVGAFPLSYKGPTIHPKLRT
ncbi:MAG TPA: HlyD family efflux transporter periplasmic adaptor subunit, partial [Candidatus Hydrogenedentes bacterium]|nr:HlyD family efflux transporter periplasmic adaptor subunit [Candidatus Hydrogenedentota bacterium]